MANRNAKSNESWMARGVADGDDGSSGENRASETHHAWEPRENPANASMSLADANEKSKKALPNTRR